MRALVIVHDSMSLKRKSRRLIVPPDLRIELVDPSHTVRLLAWESWTLRASPSRGGRSCVVDVYRAAICDGHGPIVHDGTSKALCVPWCFSICTGPKLCPLAKPLRAVIARHDLGITLFDTAQH